MIDIYLCEDEEIQLIFFRNMVQDYIEKEHIEAKIVSARSKAGDILGDAAGKEKELSLFLIDIELKNDIMNGLELAKKLKSMSKKFYYVFLTSRSELAYKTFEYELDALDYIVKEPNLFIEAGCSKLMKERLDKVFLKLKKREKVERLEGCIIFECGSRKLKISKEDIILVQSLKSMHRIEVITSNQRIISNTSLKQIEERLGGEFLWVNKSCLVNFNKIKCMDRKSRFLTLENDEVCEVSFRKVSEVWKSIRNKHENEVEGEC